MASELYVESIFLTRCFDFTHGPALERIGKNHICEVKLQTIENIMFRHILLELGNREIRHILMKRVVSCIDSSRSLHPNP